MIRVKVEVYDNRDIDVRGIIGSDMSVSVNSNVKLLEDTIKISDSLPLFNEVKIDGNKFDFSAGSAPDALGIGDAIGINGNFSVVEFDGIVLDTSVGITIDLESSERYQDALADRNANKIDKNNSNWHSLATKQGGKIKIDQPNNIDVGEYILKSKRLIQRD